MVIRKKIILLNFKFVYFKYCFSDLWRSCLVFRRVIVFRKNNKKKIKVKYWWLRCFFYGRRYDFILI